MRKGFSIIELMMAIALMVAIIGISIPVYNQWQQSNDFELSIQSTAHALRLARNQAVSMTNDDSWSVHFTSGYITIYKGDSWNDRNNVYDIIFTVNNNIDFSQGITDINFSKQSGTSNQNGDIIISFLNNSQTLSVNSLGLVNY